MRYKVPKLLTLEICWLRLCSPPGVFCVVHARSAAKFRKPNTTRDMPRHPGAYGRLERVTIALWATQLPYAGRVMPVAQCHIARSITGRTKAVSSSWLCVFVIMLLGRARQYYLLFIITARRFPRLAIGPPEWGGPGVGDGKTRALFPFLGHTARCSLPPHRHHYLQSLGKPRKNGQSSCMCACSATPCILLCAVRARTVLIAYAFLIGRASLRPTSVAWLRGCDLFSGFLSVPLPYVPLPHPTLSLKHLFHSFPPYTRFATTDAAAATASLAVRCPCAHT